MDEKIADLVLGGDAGDIVLGKEPDWTRPFKTFSIVLGIAIVGSFFLSIFIEEYRLQALMQEVRSMSLNGIQCAVEEMQNIGEEDMSYLVDDSGKLSNEYKNYLDELSSVNNDAEMQNVVSILRNGDSNGERYTPLSFNLTFLDKSKLKDLIRSNLTEIFATNNSTEFSNGVNNSGSVFEELIFGGESTEFVDCDVEVERMHVIDITNVSNCSEDEKAMYRAVYGTENQAASKLDGLGLTDKHYLIVYQVKYSVTWVPYTRSVFFQRRNSSAKKNSDGFLALPEITDEYTELYYITN